jgi:hypothetical protein
VAGRPRLHASARRRGARCAATVAQLSFTRVVAVGRRTAVRAFHSSFSR